MSKTKWRLLIQQPHQSVQFSSEHRDNITGLVHTRVDGEFDELVVGDWLHVEMMSDDACWLQVGNAILWVNRTKGCVTVTIHEGEVDPSTGKITGGREPVKRGTIGAAHRKSKRSR
jgi:hypothetical protein